MCALQKCNGEGRKEGPKCDDDTNEPNLISSYCATKTISGSTINSCRHSLLLVLHPDSTGMMIPTIGLPGDTLLDFKQEMEKLAEWTTHACAAHSAHLSV